MNIVKWCFGKPNRSFSLERCIPTAGRYAGTIVELIYSEIPRLKMIRLAEVYVQARCRFLMVFVDAKISLVKPLLPLYEEDEKRSLAYFLKFRYKRTYPFEPTSDQQHLHQEFSQFLPQISKAPLF